MDIDDLFEGNLNIFDLKKLSSMTIKIRYRKINETFPAIPVNEFKILEKMLVKFKFEIKWSIETGNEAILLFLIFSKTIRKLFWYSWALFKTFSKFDSNNIPIEYINSKKKIEIKEKDTP